MAGGPDLYGYAGGDPVNLADPSGENPIVAGAVLGAVAGAGIYHFTMPASSRTLGGYVAWAGGGAVVGGSLGFAAGVVLPAGPTAGGTLGPITVVDASGKVASVSASAASAGPGRRRPLSNCCSGRAYGDLHLRNVLFLR